MNEIMNTDFYDQIHTIRNAVRSEFSKTDHEEARLHQ